MARMASIAVVYGRRRENEIVSVSYHFPKPDPRWRNFLVSGSGSMQFTHILPHRNNDVRFRGI